MSLTGRGRMCGPAIMKIASYWSARYFCIGDASSSTFLPVWLVLFNSELWMSKIPADSRPTILMVSLDLNGATKNFLK